MPTRAEIWAAIHLKPRVIVLILRSFTRWSRFESNFDPRACNGEACGLLQLKSSAWAAVSSIPFELSVWDWRANLEAGIAHLAFCRSTCNRQPGVEFSYPLLLAAFHYGLDYVEERRFDVRRLECPDNAVYRELWRGQLTPIAPPG